MHSLKTAKALWDHLVQMYEGDDEVSRNSCDSINKRYEEFVGEEGEDVTQVYSRFTTLINDLEVSGIKKDSYDVMVRFLRSLPSEWRDVQRLWRNNDTLKNLTLTTLHSKLMNEERETKALRERDSKRGLKALVVASPPVYAQTINSITEVSEDEEEEIEQELLNLEEVSFLPEEEQALIANFRSSKIGKFRKNKRPVRNFSFRKSTPSTPATSAPVKAEDRACFKCGQTGHLIANCYSKKTTAEYERQRGDRYKLKLKQACSSKPQQRTMKGMVAEAGDEAWFKSDSEDDVMALMAITDEEPDGP